MLHRSLLRRRRGFSFAMPCVLTAMCAAFCGCSALNPAFIDLFDTDGKLAQTENAPGHVVISFINNAEVDEQLRSYLTKGKPEGGGVELTPGEILSLRPRLRFRVRVDFVDGSFNVFEFVDGSPKLVDADFDQQADPDLNDNDLDNVVVVCPVASIAIVGAIEVFVPVAIEQWRLVVPELGGDAFFVQEAENSADGLQFIQLDSDIVDADENVVLKQNIGIRDSAVPVIGPSCGSVVAFVINGVLSVPFAPGLPTESPAVRIDDPQSVGSIGGRYEIEVQIR